MSSSAADVAAGLGLDPETLNFSNRSHGGLSCRLPPIPATSSSIMLKFLRRPMAINCGRKKCRLFEAMGLYEIVYIGHRPISACVCGRVDHLLARTATRTPCNYPGCVQRNLRRNCQTQDST
jgi:hypothetical protein